MKLYFLPISFVFSMNTNPRVFLLLVFLMSILCSLPAQTPYAPYYEKTINAYTNMAEGNYSLDFMKRRFPLAILFLMTLPICVTVILPWETLSVR